MQREEDAVRRVGRGDCMVTQQGMLRVHAWPRELGWGTGWRCGVNN